MSYAKAWTSLKMESTVWKLKLLGWRVKFVSWIPGQALDCVSDCLRKLQDDSRSANIRITGIDKIPDENHEQTRHKVQKLSAAKLQLPNIAVLRDFRARKQQTKLYAVLRYLIAKLVGCHLFVIKLPLWKHLRYCAEHLRMCWKMWLRPLLISCARNDLFSSKKRWLL